MQPWLTSNRTTSLAYTILQSARALICDWLTATIAVFLTEEAKSHDFTLLMLMGAACALNWSLCHTAPRRARLATQHEGYRNSPNEKVN